MRHSKPSPPLLGPRPYQNHQIRAGETFETGGLPGPHARPSKDYKTDVCQDIFIFACCPAQRSARAGSPGANSVD